MITNKDDFTKKRKTRLELLEDRILLAENTIQNLKNEFAKDNQMEIKKIEIMLKELREMRENIKNIETEDNNSLLKEIQNVKENCLMIINNEKMKVVVENENLQKQRAEKDKLIMKMKEEIAQLNFTLKQSKIKEEKLLEKNSELENNYNSLQSRAYGYDIAKKFELHQKKINQEKNNKVLNENDRLALNFWEKENLKNNKVQTKLEDLTKQNALWIGNPSSNIDKLMREVSNPYNNNGSISNLKPPSVSDMFLSKESYNKPTNKQNIYTNMRKISPMILNNK
jgi:hypothetical protein